MAIEFIKICDGLSANFGTKGCQKELGELVKPYLVDPALSLDETTADLDQAALDLLICQGRVVPMPAAVFTSNAEDNVRAAQGNSGVQRPVRDGLFAGNFQFIEGGSCLGNALASLKSKKWAMWIGDANGALAVNRTDNGFIEGFKTSYIDRGNTAYNDGSDVTKYSIDFQFNKAGNRAWNNSVDILENNVEWDAVEGVNDVQLVATGGTGDVVISAKLACDGSTGVANQENNFLVTEVGPGTTSTAAATYDAATGDYTITGLTAGNYTVKLQDNTNNCGVTQDAEGSYYASNEPTFTVA